MATTAGPGSVVAGRYRLARPLAADRVWLATDLSSADERVLKRLEPDVASRVGAAIGRGLAPLANVEVVGDPGDPWLAMPYLPGGEIGRLRGRPWRECVAATLPVVDALDALHTAGWVHGDLKAGNVVLDGSGVPRLVDFGCLRPVGSDAPVGRSTWTSSPSQRAGERASPADDVYSVGALLHELVTGHPPGYLQGDSGAANVASSMRAIEGVPSQLAALVERCLQASAGGRPTAGGVRAELEACLAGAPARPRTPPPEVRPPPGPVTIRPVPRAAATAGPTVGALRREGFRRGVLVSAFAVALLAALFVFFVLPGLVERRAPPSAAPAVRAAAAAAPAEQALPSPEDLERLAQLKTEFERLRPGLDPRVAALRAHDAATWGRPGLDALVNRIAEADARAAVRDYEAAVGAVRRAIDEAGALERAQAAALAAALQAGAAAIDSGRSEDARTAYAAALRIDPGNAAARRGSARAARLDEALEAASAGAVSEQDGNCTGAIAAYRRALAIDPETRVARDGVARCESRIAGDAYSTAVARGLSALSRRDYVSARAAFEQAGRLRPGAPEVADGLRQVQLAQQTSGLAETLARAARAEADERWADALAAYREALSVDPTLAAAQAGIARSEPRAMLDAGLQSYIDRPMTLFSTEGRGAAQLLVDRARAQPGPRRGSPARSRRSRRCCARPRRRCRCSSPRTT